VTADALLHDPQLRRLDIVDIAKEVFALAGSYAESPDASPLRDPRVTTHVQDGRFFLQASPRQYDLITGEPPPLKVAGTVNLYTEEFFSLLRARLKEGGMATFWLPIWQLRVDEVKAILAAFHHAFPNASVWAGPDEEWILLGINGPGRTLTADEIGRLWSIPATRADLTRIGLEVPGNLWAQFLMDRGDIEQLTQGVAPLTDRYPKRLTDLPPDPKAIRRFAAGYFEVSAAWHRFLASPLIARLWPEEPKTALEPFFVDREIRYTTSSQGGNWLATLDLYLRSSSLRTPVLEALNSDEFRVAIARRQAGGVAMPPAATLPDLVADALARRDVAAAVGRLETERIRGFANPNDLFLLIYLDCLNGHVDAAEVLATAAAGSIQKDWFVDWLWQKLEADFGFHPPP
jgi:hypothetical protein